MTMNEVIEYVDGVKPNVFEDEDKYKWLATLDGMISVEVHCMAEPVRYELPEAADTPLLVPAPWDDMYALYVEAMIDLHNREYDHYNNAVMVFQERLDAYKRYYIQRQVHNAARNFRNVMG